MCPLAGGNWNNSTNAGVWALNLNNNRGNSNTNEGFRADSMPLRRRQRQGGVKGDAFRLVRIIALAKSVCRRISGSDVRRERQASGS